MCRSRGPNAGDLDIREAFYLLHGYRGVPFEWKVAAGRREQPPGAARQSRVGVTSRRQNHLVRPERGTDEDFERFRKYGEGQEKLLMLHLQDHYPDGVSIDGRDVESIARGMGNLAPELVDIELGSWSGKDTRWLARKCGMEKLYRLVFAPTSSDVHGSWMSLKSSNFLCCGEILHRFHRIPSYVEPPVYVDTIKVPHDILSHCLRVAVDWLNYPPFPEPLEHAAPRASGDEEPDP